MSTPASADLPSPTAAVVLDNLTVSYRGHPALHHLSGRFERGSLTAVVGPNGAGKSTLLKTLAGLMGHGVAKARTSVAMAVPAAQVAYLPQHGEIDRHFPLPVRECVALGLWRQCGPWGAVSPAQHLRVEAALDAVGLHGFGHRALGTLSSGQLQRALFARLVVQDASLILLDEPFNAVDSSTTEALLALVRQWHAQGRTVVAVLHDHAMVRAHFAQTLLLARRCIAWGATPNVLTPEHLQAAAGTALAWDERAGVCTQDALESATAHAT